MKFRAKHQRIPGQRGDWNLVRAYGDARYTLLEYDRKRITLDGSTGEVVRVTERNRES